MPLKPFKFVVQAVVVEEDEYGNIIGERTSEQPNVLYGLDAFKKFAETFEARLQDLEQEDSE